MPRQIKDSGIAWIGNIPVNWSVQKVKNAFYRSKEEAHIEDPVVLSLARSGVKVRDISNNEGQLAESYYNYNPVVSGDLLLNPMDLYSGANCSVSKVEGVISPAYINLRTRGEYCPTYYDYYFKTQYWAMALFAHGKGVSFDNRWTLSPNDLFNYAIPVPSLEEQERIAEFLDYQCSEIDMVIAKTKLTIEEYKKLKQSVITEAVTKGVRGNRPMRDSGIEWIGDIPSEWSTSYLKYAMRWKSIKGQPDATVLSLYRDYGVVPKDSRDDNHNVTSLDTSGYKVVSVGDFVINKMKAWQGSMAVSEYAGIISPAYHICEITDTELNKKYLHHLLRNHLYLPEYARLSTGMRIGQWDLGYDDFKNLPFIIPPREEQDEIVDFIESGLSKYDTLIAKKTALLEEMESYKKSVIYEYVTGKKEVL